MVKRRTGLDPLAYMGVEPSMPAQFVREGRNPTTTDYEGYNIGTVWIVKGTNAVFMLVDKALFIATWRQFTAGVSALNTLTGDVGGIVPATANNIDIFGSGPYVFTGNPGMSLLTLSDDGSLATQYDGDIGSAVPAANILNILGANGIATSGAGNTMTVGVTAGVFVKTLTGIQGGGAIPPDGADNINITGAGGITVTGAGNTLTITGGGGSGLEVKVTKFTANDTFIRDARCVYVTVIAWNAGSGAGSGRQGASTLACGGSGAAGGGLMVVTFPAIQIDPLGETVTVGAAGIGGAAQAVANTNGNDGVIGGYSALGSAFTDIVNGIIGPPFGPNGKGGFNPPYPPFPLGGEEQYATNEYITTTPITLANSGGRGSTTNNQVDAPSTGSTGSAIVEYTCTGGGGGSGADSVIPRQAGNSGSIYGWGRGNQLGTPIRFGAFGGIETGIIDGDAGLNFISTTGVRIIASTGGGGGGGQSVGVVAGNGGAGGIPGAGGGGGGGSLNGTNSGIGGDGGRGEVWVYEYLGTLT